MNKGFYSISKSKKYEAPTSASYAVTASHLLGSVVSASYAVTASYIDPNFISASAAASGFGSGGGTFDSSSFVTNSQTGSFVLNSQTSSFVTNSQTGSFIRSNQTSSFAITGSNSFIGTQRITGSLIISGSGTMLDVTGNIYLRTLADPASLDIFTTVVTVGSGGKLFTNSLTNYLLNTQTGSFVLNSQTSSFVTNSQTGSFVTNNQTGSFLTYGTSGTTQTISGSLIINQNLTVLGSSSILNITSSQLNIGTNLITVNTSTPAVRYGGLAVYDSGSTGLTGSLLWDSQRNIWIYTNPSGSANYDSAMVLMGPESKTGLGSEVGITTYCIPKGAGSHHLSDSNIFNTPDYISLGLDTQITGSLMVTEGTISGSILGYVANTQTGSFILSSQTGSMTVASASYISSVKAGSGSVASFTGTPLVSAITFGTAYSNNSYSVTVTGEDARVWSVQSKTATGFTINSNSSQALTGPVYWIATPFN